MLLKVESRTVLFPLYVVGLWNRWDLQGCEVRGLGKKVGDNRALNDEDPPLTLRKVGLTGDELCNGHILGSEPPLKGLNSLDEYFTHVAYYL